MIFPVLVILVSAQVSFCVTFPAIVSVGGSLADGAGLSVPSGSGSGPLVPVCFNDGEIGPVAALTSSLFASIAFSAEGNPTAYLQTRGSNATRSLVAANPNGKVLPSSVDTSPGGLVLVGSTSFSLEQPFVAAFTSTGAHTARWGIPKPDGFGDDVFLKSVKYCGGRYLYALWSGSVNNGKTLYARLQSLRVVSSSKVTQIALFNLGEILATGAAAACNFTASSDRLYLSSSSGVVVVNMTPEGIVANTQSLTTLPEMLGIALGPTSGSSQSFFATPSLDAQATCGLWTFQLDMNSPIPPPSPPTCIAASPGSKNYVIGVATWML